MKKRKKCSIQILDFIKNNFKKNRLFNTINHPANKTLLYLTNLILEKLGINDYAKNPSYEMFGMTVYPILPFLFDYLDFEFILKDNTNFVINKQKLSFNQFYNTCIDFYNNNKDIIPYEYNFYPFCFDNL